MKKAKEDYVVFLRNETFIAPRWLEELVQVLDAHPDVDACQSVIVYAETNDLQTVSHTLDVYGCPLLDNNKTNGGCLNRLNQNNVSSLSKWNFEKKWITCLESP